VQQAKSSWNAAHAPRAEACANSKRRPTWSATGPLVEKDVISKQQLTQRWTAADANKTALADDAIAHEQAAH